LTSLYNPCAVTTIPMAILYIFLCVLSQQQQQQQQGRFRVHLGFAIPEELVQSQSLGRFAPAKLREC